MVEGFLQDKWILRDDYYTQLCDNFIRNLSDDRMDHYLKNPSAVFYLLPE